MTAPQEYVNALDKALADLEDRVHRRDLLNAEIAGLRETVRVLSTLGGMQPERRQRVAQLMAMIDYATPSLTDAIRSLLIRSYPNEMTAIEVRNALEESGFNFGDFSNSLSACHSALKRLASEEDVDVEVGKPKDGKTTYKGVLKMTAPPSGALAKALFGQDFHFNLSDLAAGTVGGAMRKGLGRNRSTIGEHMATRQEEEYGLSDKPSTRTHKK